jgi:hypothetical protein
MAGAEPIQMLKHFLGEVLYDAYPYDNKDAELEPFLSFAVYNPDKHTFYLVPDRLIIPKREKVITLGVECDAILDPVIVFEWFGKGSEFLARWDKVQTYRAFPSIQQYIALVASEPPYVEQHTRVGDRWEISVRTAEDRIDLVDGKMLPLSEIFQTY